MAVITTGSHPKALWPGVAAWWGRSYNEHKEEFPDLFDQETSDKAYEEEVEISGFGLFPVKNEGTAITYDTEQQGATTRYTHVAYASGYIVTYEELRDDLYEIVSKRRAQQLAFSARQTQENIGANVYNRAFNTAYPIGDGAALISASHPTLSGANQSNLLTTSADLSETALEDMLIQIAQTLNSRGLHISVLPKTLIIPVQLWFEANRIMKSVLQSDTANNNINVLKATNAIPGGVVQNHYLTSATAWFVRTNVPHGMMWYNREEMSFDQDNEFSTKNALAAAYMRFSAGGTDFRGIAGTPGV
jgi:hypothetical protein